MTISDTDLSEVIKLSTALLRAEYNYTHEVTDSMLKVIDSLASIVETTYIRFDPAFKEECYMWEYRRRVEEEKVDFVW